MVEATQVWAGAPDLHDALVPLDELTTHPDNPKKGDIDEIVRSLDRFGQVRAVLVDGEGVIVAGNHTVLAARKLGWTHVAAVANPFKTPDEARAYLLADNRLGDLGEYDRAELLVYIEEVEKLGAWGGTGYVQDDLEHLRALEAAAAAPRPEPVSSEPPAPLAPPPPLSDIVLDFTEEQKTVFGEKVRELRVRYDLEGVTETVLRAVHDEALLVNQGA